MASADYTNADGLIDFYVAGGDGVVTYTAYDATVDKVLDAKARVVYYDSPQDILSASVGNSSGPVSGFEFDDLPESVTPGETITATVKAVDDADQTVINYLGTVRFSAIGSNGNYAVLPSDYTFTTQDQGEHTFSLAMSFSQPGTYNVEVRDIDNFALFGEHTFIVQDSGNFNAVSGSGVSLSTPISGTSSNRIQVVSGTAAPGAALKIYDNNLELGSVVADVSGNFSYTTPQLADGLHQIYVARVNEVGTILDTSGTVSLTIDSAAPDVANVVIEPSDTVDPGSVVKVKLYVEESLSKAAMEFNGNLFEMKSGGPGYYEVNLSAPIAFGEYAMNFLITDQLGNETRVDNAASLQVGGLLAGQSALGDVTGLTASASDNRVSLEWQAPSAFSGAIANYRVFYGLSPNQLTEAVDTFTNATTWYIPNLKNNTPYYFAVVAVDNVGNISPHFSNIASATPNPAVVNADTPNVGATEESQEALEELKGDVSDTGPEIWWLVWLSLAAGYFYNLASKRKESLVLSERD